MLRLRTLRPHTTYKPGGMNMAKGQAKQATNNKPKLSTKEKQAKKAEKLAKK